MWLWPLLRSWGYLSFSFTFGVLLLSCCRLPQEAVASDRNGPITLSEVRQAASYLQLGQLKRDDELRLARDLALVRELSRRAREELLDQQEAVRYLLTKYLPLRLRVRQALNRQVEAELAQGIVVVRSRALTLKLSEEEIISGSPVSETKIKQIYNEVISGQKDFSTVLKQYSQNSDFRELPLALFPPLLQAVMKNCLTQEKLLLPPVDLGAAWMLVECTTWRRVTSSELQKLLPESREDDREHILTAERERLRKEIRQKYAIHHNLARDWQQQVVLFQENNTILTRQDFTEEIRFEAWRRNITPTVLLQRYDLLNQLYRESCLRLRLAATENISLDDGWLLWEREALLARLMLFQLLANRGEKMLDLPEGGFSEAASSSELVRDLENQILREINFQFAHGEH